LPLSPLSAPGHFYCLVLILSKPSCRVFGHSLSQYYAFHDCADRDRLFSNRGYFAGFGLLIAPAGAGALLAKRIEAMMAWAVLFGSISMYFGYLSVSFQLSCWCFNNPGCHSNFLHRLHVQNIRNRRVIPVKEANHG